MTPINSEDELRHLEKAVDFQVHIHKLKSLQYEAKARTTPDIYDPELVNLREELAMAWSEYRIAQKMLNNFAITDRRGRVDE